MATPQSFEDIPRAIGPQRPFVGRRRELDVLRAHLGRAGMVILTGDPGIGKTRLAEEFAADAAQHGARVHWGRCWEGDGAPAFWPWIQILRAHAEHDDGGGETAGVLADLEGNVSAASDLLDPAPSRFRLFDTVTSLLTRTAAASPLVLILEDLHWADKPSIVLLQFLVRHARTAPILVIATYRDVDVDKTHPLTAALNDLARRGEPIALAGLAASDVARYVAAALGDERAHALAERLHHETEGHPFFLVELVRLLEASAGAVVAGIPDGVRELIARRLRQRSPACRELLTVAAVIGRDFALPVLQRASERASHDVVALLGEALDARLIVPGTDDPATYRFAHALIREALYADTALARRIQLHRQIGHAIEDCAGADGDTHAAVLAHHFREAAADGDLEPAVHYGIRAGDRATQALAHEEAVAHYERTLQILERRGARAEPRRCPLLLALGLAQVRAGEPAAAELTFMRAAALARQLGLPQELSRAALGLGEIERQDDRLVPVLEEALAALAPHDSVLRARLLSRLSVALYWAKSEERKRALSDEAVTMARRLGYVPTLAYALSGRIAALSGPDDVEARLAAATEMVTIADQAGHRELAMIGRGWIAADALALGDLDHARFTIATFATMASASRHPYFEWWLAAIRTMEAMLEGRLAEAETLAHDCFARGRRTVAADATQVFAGHFYMLAMEGERHDQLEPVVRGLVEQFPGVIGGRCALALLHADRGRVAEAVAEIDALAVDRFAALPRNPEWLNSLAALTQASTALPGAPHAATLYELLTPYRRRIIVAGMGVLCTGAVAHYLGMLARRLGRFDEAAACFEEALGVHARIGAVPCLAYTQYEYAALMLERASADDAARAAAFLGDARRAADAHGMHRLLRLLDALPATSGVTDPVRANSSVQRTGLLRKEGDFWRLAWDRSEFRLRDRIGLHYLAALIASPAREFLAVDLVRASGARRAESPEIAVNTTELGSPRPLTNAEATPDLQAETAYRRRLAELRETLDEARRDNDIGRIARARDESDAITRELARAMGLQSRGRDSRSPIERARVSATRAIRGAIRLIEANDRGYGRHLAVTIKTGTFCSYVPDPEVVVSWQL